MFDNKQGIYSTIFISNFRTGLFIRTPEVSMRLYTMVNIPIIIMMFNMYVPADGLFLLNVPNDDNNNIITPIDTIRLNEPIKKVFNVSFKVVGTDVELLYHNIIVIKNITTNEIVNRFVPDNLGVILYGLYVNIYTTISAISAYAADLNMFSGLYILV
jgi:hypothetical protein